MFICFFGYMQPDTIHKTSGNSRLNEIILSVVITYCMIIISFYDGDVNLQRQEGAVIYFLLLLKDFFQRDTEYPGDAKSKV